MRERSSDEIVSAFSVSDRPVLQVLHLYREEVLAERQQIKRAFVPLQETTGIADATQKGH
jgi:hypothetical protein